MKCLECDNTSPDSAFDMQSLGWRYIQLIDDEDKPSGNGWRCPQCTDRYNATLEAIWKTQH
jgi:hypothetical protein